MFKEPGAAAIGRTWTGSKWEEKLEEAWRVSNGGEASAEAAEVERRCVVLASCPLFARRTTKELRIVALAMEHLEREEGEAFYDAGDAPNGVFLLEAGGVVEHTRSAFTQEGESRARDARRRLRRRRRVLPGGRDVFHALPADR